MMTQPGHPLGRRDHESVADVLERVLDKGVVIAGDIVVNVLDIELLSLKLRLFVASAQTAREMGMDWWTRDAFFCPGTARTAAAAPPVAATAVAPPPEVDRLSAENHALRAELAQLREVVYGLAAGLPPAVPGGSGLGQVPA